MELGAKVKILPPFNEAFPDVYVIYFIEGNTAFLMGLNQGFPEGFSDAFDIQFLEVVND